MDEKKGIIFLGVLVLAAIAGHWGPSLLDLPGSQVQGAIVLILFPFFLFFVWWTR